MSLADEATTVKNKLVPPDVLLRIFKYLPVPTLANVALVSRRFKVLVYDDEIWDEKLRIMLKNDTGALSNMLGNRNIHSIGDTLTVRSTIETNDTKENGSLIDVKNTIYINNKPLSALIPGMSTDPFQTRARAKSTGLSKERFKELYRLLIPYYVDLRDHNKESNKVLHDFGNQPEVCGQIINLLVGFGQCHVLDDWKQVMIIITKGGIQVCLQTL